MGPRERNIFSFLLCGELIHGASSIGLLKEVLWGAPLKNSLGKDYGSTPDFVYGELCIAK